MKRLILFAFSLGMVWSTAGAAGAQRTIPHIATADLPTIDGDVSDWEALFGAPHFAQADFSSGAGISGTVPESDQKVEVWVGWNEERNLVYVGARVTDNLYGTTTSNGPGDVWKSDDIEVGIDADNSKGTNDNGHAQWYMLNPEGKYGAVLFNLNRQMNIVEPPSAQSAVTRTGNIYQYELAIPGWDINRSAVERHILTADEVIGLAIVFADFESTADADAAEYHAYNVLDGQGGGLAFNADRYPEFRLEGPKVAVAATAAMDIAVTTTADVLDFSGAQQVGDLPGPDGVVSLREAIIAANKTAGPQTIGFRIPTSDSGFDGVVFRIQPTTTLPPITGGGTSIDGDTQAELTGNTNPVGPEVVLDGSQITSGDGYGLRIDRTSGCLINRLVIQNFTRAVMQENIAPAGVILNADRDNRITNCYIGTDHTGTQGRGNVNGILLHSIGSVLAGNLISGNKNLGIILGGSREIRIGGNLVGTDITGTKVVPNSIGIQLSGSGNVIGGANPADQNVVSGNSDIGVNIVGDGQIMERRQHRIQGNYIGVAIDGKSPLGNLNFGILNSNAEPEGQVSPVLIGGTGSGEGNIIAFNTGGGGWNVGVALWPPWENTLTFKGSVTISGNSIHSNGGLGIDTGTYGPTPNDPGDTDTGPNALMNYPVLDAAVVSGTTLAVEGTLDTPDPETATVEFFANPVPTPGGDPSGYGEGAVFLGAATPDATGRVKATFPEVAIGTLISATATDAAGHTSEFARNVAVTTGDIETPANPALATPQLSSPANGAVDQPVGEDQPRLFLRWSRVTGATSYQVMVDERADFASPVLDRLVALGTSTPLDSIDYATTYNWRVRAVNERGPGPWSETWQFTTGADLAPHPLSPVNGAAGLPIGPDAPRLFLRWEPAAGAISYQVVVDEEADFASPVLDRTVAVDTATPLDDKTYETTYYWRVRAIRAEGPGPWSDTWHFTTAESPVPIPVSPADATTTQPIELSLRWEGVAAATSYHLMVDEDEGFGSPLVDRAGLVETTYDLSSLQYKTTYFWRVRMVSDQGTSKWSSVSRFTTTLGPLNPALAAPGLTSPQDGETNLPGTAERGELLLRWASVSGATSYQIMVDEEADFASPVLDRANITGSTVIRMGTRRFGIAYYWRVRAVNIDGPGEWSAVWRFTTEDLSAVAPAPELISPANGATDQPLNLSLQWQAVEGTANYMVEIGAASRTQFGVGNAVAYLMKNMRPGTTYSWRVRSQNQEGRWGNWSDTWQFTTQAEPGSEPVNAPPVARAGADQTVEAGATVQLDGSGSSDAEGNTLTYRWSVPAGISLSSTTTPQPSFTATAAGTYRFTLVVNDGQADSASDEVVVVVNQPVVNPPANTAPIAHAGADQSVEVGATVQLDGSTSSDAEGSSLTYRWTAPQGVILSSTTTPQPSFAASAAGTYRFSLVVSDGQQESAVDEVVVVVREAPLKAPEAPQLASPANGSERAFPTGLSLGWSASTGAASYRVQVGTEPDFASPLLDRSGLAVTSVATGGLSYGTTYYWRVRANNTAGTSPWSATWSFAIKGKLPGLPAEPIQIYEIDPPPDLHDGSTGDWFRADVGPSLQIEHFAPVPGIGEAAAIDPADLAFRVFLGWNRQTQKVYMAIERVDDAHIGNYPGGKPANIWRFDGVELLVDGDRSGGAYNWPEGEDPTDEAERKLLVNSQAQQYLAIPESPDNRTLTYSGIFAGVDQDWMVQPPFADAGGSVAGSAPATVLVEMAVTAWDTLNWQGAAQSKASVLAPDKLIGLQISVPDFDTEPGTYRGFYTIGGLADTWRNADTFAEAVLLGEGPGSPALSPGTPTLVSPANGDRIQAAEVSLSWQADDLSSSYDVQLSTDASFASLVVNTNTTETSLLASDLKESTTYYWRVMGRLGIASGGVGNWSEVRSFTVERVPLPNTSPTASAGTDQIVEVGATVQLDGTSSSDAEGNTLSYRWIAPSDITLSSTTAAQPTFAASAAGTYRFSLVVNDGQQDSAPDEVVVVAQPVVVPPANSLPQAQAGVDLVTTVGATVQLDGGGSSDAEGALAGYVWTQVAGPAASLSDVQSAAPTFVPGQPGVYRFELSVSDAQSASAVDQVNVIVLSQAGVRISRENVVQVQAVLVQVLANTVAKGPGIHLGAYSGQVVVALARAKVAQTDLVPQYDLAYDNYSDDGELVVDGAVRYTQTAEEIRYAGDLELFGQYTGQMDLDVQVGEGGPRGTVKTDEVVYALEEVADVLAPSAPIDLTVPGVTGEEWSTKADFSLQWTSPEDQAGIARVHYKVGAPPTANEDQTGSVEGAGPFQITLTEQGTIPVHVWLEDQAGNVDFAQHTTVTLRYDATPPALNWTPPETLPLGRDLKVSVQATEVSGVASAALYYRPGGQGAYQSIPLQPTTGSEYAATLPGSAISYAGVQYYVQVQDLVGLGATLPAAGEAGPYSAPVRFQDFVRDSAFPTGVWRMVSVPVQPSNGSPFEVLTALGAYDINQWRLYRYFQGRYQELTQTDIGGFAPGRAFWLHTRIVDIKLHSGGGQTAPLDQPVELNLEPGWNDLAVPFAFAVRWDDVMATSGDPAGVAGPFAYDGQAWAFPTPSERLEPWEGYAVKNSNATSVVLKVPARAAAAGKAVAKELVESEWVLQVRVVGAEGGDVHNYRRCCTNRGETSFPFGIDFRRSSRPCRIEVFPDGTCD